MAELNITNIPAPRVPFIDARTGLMAREWYRFFLNLFVLTGNGSNQTSLDELQIGPPNQPSLTELLIQINQNVATQPVVQTGTIASYNLDGSPTKGGIAYGTGPALAVSAAGTTGQVLTSSGAGTPTWATPTTGTVTSVSVATANGLAGAVATATTTPAITLSTTITGLLKGNGTAISAAASGTDYAPATSGTSILYGNGSGGFNNVTIGTGVAFATGTLSATGSGGTVTSVSGTAGRITSTGGTTPVIDLVSGIATPGTTGSVSLIPVVTIDTYGRVTSITTAANPQGTVTSVTGTAPVVSSGGATPAISMAAATTSVNGYLTSTDWTTFNNKQPAGSYLVNGGALGTPSSGTATNLTGTATGLTAGNATTAVNTNGGAVTLGASSHLTLGANSYVLAGSTYGFLINSSGDLLNLYKFDNFGSVRWYSYGAGTITSDANGNLTSVSGEEYKIKDGAPKDPVRMLMDLKPEYYFWADTKRFNKQRQLGFFAQNVNKAIGEEAAPTPVENVWLNEKGEESRNTPPWGYYDRSVLSVTVLALQKLKTEFDAYKVAHP